LYFLFLSVVNPVIERPERGGKNPGAKHPTPNPDVSFDSIGY